MKLAFLRLRNLGWMALVFLVAILLYPLSLSVASTRNSLHETETEIVRTKQRIRYLETEFSTRASLQQLQLWNDLEFGFVAPDASQYLDGERALANLGKDRNQLHEPVRVAVMTAQGDVKPAGVIGSPFGDAAALQKRGDTAIGGPANAEGQEQPEPETEQENGGVALASADHAQTKSEAEQRAAFARRMDIQLLTERSAAPASSEGGR